MIYREKDNGDDKMKEQNISDRIHALNRFLTAQEYNYEDALREIKNGKKCSCWMWYVFPQIKGLGQSNMAVFYAIEDKEEAEAYLKHEVLGKRLREITEELLKLETNNADQVFGYPDNLKLRSSMTLFACVTPEETIFQEVLNKFFTGQMCERTLNLLNL